MKNLKYATETTVEKILKYNSSKIEKELNDYKSFSQNGLSGYSEKIQKIENFLEYLKEAKTIIKNNKLKPKQRIAIAFTPKLLTKTSTQTLNHSKVGGVPFCFLTEETAKLLKNKTHFLEHIEKIYPKSRYGTCLNFIGDIQSDSPTFFMKELMETIKSGKDNINLFSTNNYENFASNAFGSFFMDQNFSSMSSQDSTGVFLTLKYQHLYSFNEDEIKTYVKLMTEFMNNNVPKECYAMDKIELMNIDGWNIELELLTDIKSFFFESLSNQPQQSSNFKLFGYPDSQQSIYPYYCTSGFFGPRLLSPFLSIQNRKVDTTIQIYADFLDINHNNQESRYYLKVDISST